MAHAQRKFESQEILWLQYYMQIELSPRWSCLADVGLRRSDQFVAKPFTQLARMGIQYKLSSTTSLAGGAAYFEQYTRFEEFRPEYRSWFQITSESKLGEKSSLQHRIRAEQRWQQVINDSSLADHYTYANRFRSQISLRFPVPLVSSAKFKPFIVLFDEIFAQVGPSITYNVFDQNRVFLGVGISLVQGLQVVGGYQYSTIQSSKLPIFFHPHALRLVFQHSIKTYKNENQEP